LSPPLTPRANFRPTSPNSNFEPGDPLQVVVVRVYYEWSLFAPGMTYMANMSDGRRLLAAGAAFRNEPYGQAIERGALMAGSKRRMISTGSAC
jgi:hypothetical protein